MANKKRRRKPANHPRPATASRPADRTGDAGDADEGRGNGRPRGARPVSTAAAQGGDAAQRSRAEKKDLARQQREAVRRRIERQRRVRQGAYVAVVAVAIAVGVFVFTNGNEAPKTSNPNRLPGILTTDAPWPINVDDVQARAKAIGLPSHSNNLALHNHVEVQIFVHGQREPIPANVGIGPTYAASVHTHTDDGIVHVESATVADFTLQEFFDVWGVRFTDSCLGSYCNSGANQLQVWQGGQEVTGGLGATGLDDQSVIVVTYGTKSELPSPIPSSFDFTNA